MTAKPFRVLVCGGRRFHDAARLFTALDGLADLLGPLHVIEGGAHGADELAGRWAARNGALCGGHTRCPADWKRHGRRAGTLRNSHMLNAHQPDVVLAAPGGTGTGHMISIALKAGVPVFNLSLERVPRC